MPVCVDVQLRSLEAPVTNLPLYKVRKLIVLDDLTAAASRSALATSRLAFWLTRSFSSSALLRKTEWQERLRSRIFRAVLLSLPMKPSRGGSTGMRTFRSPPRPHWRGAAWPPSPSRRSRRGNSCKPAFHPAPVSDQTKGRKPCRPLP